MPQSARDQAVRLLAEEQRHSTDSLPPAYEKRNGSGNGNGNGSDSNGHGVHGVDNGKQHRAICNPNQNDVPFRRTAAGAHGRKTRDDAHHGHQYDPHGDDGDSDDDIDGIELDEMDPDARRPGYHRPTGGKSGTPLLSKADTEANVDGDDDGLGRLSYDGYQAPTAQRPTFSRRSTMRITAAEATRKKYTLAALFLGVSLVSFCIQTELSAHIQHDLGWDKAYCMMYFTHSSWIVLWPIQLLCLRLQKRDMPWDLFWSRHKQHLKATATMVEMQTLDVFGASIHARSQPVRYMIRVTAFITSALTVAGLSWYIAVSLTTPSDLTAIYNCSAFFAYIFSVPFLKEPLRFDKSMAVLLAIVGVLVVAYGDTEPAVDGQAEKPSGGHEPTAGSRFAGNLIIGVGSVLYGLYEVLYKRFACPPEGVSAGRGMIFANTFGSCIGLFTLTVLWIPLPILHFLHIERFELPVASTCWLILCAVLSNATFSGSFLVLISLTSPVLSSVAALLTIFIVALADWILTGVPLSFAAMAGGSMIVVAFLALSWSTYREMMEHEAQKQKGDFTDSDDEGDASENEN